MNIFILDENPKTAAQYNCDKHVVKMVTELYQQLGSAVIRHGAKPKDMPLTSKGTPLKGGYHNHPCTRWCGDSKNNYEWAVEHALELCTEYTRRYGKVHACEAGIVHLAKMRNFIPDGFLTSFALAMPDEYKSEDAVESYRTYYLNDKKAFAKWEKSNNVPFWWKL
jgi:hypothetical protein